MANVIVGPSISYHGPKSFQLWIRITDYGLWTNNFSRDALTNDESAEIFGQHVNWMKCNCIHSTDNTN